MKKILILLLLFTLVGFLSANQVIITNDYQYIVSTGKTYNFNNGNPSNNVKYDRTNKIQIQNNKVIANPLKYHYAFFWQEDNTFIGYYKTNKGLTTSGAYLGQVNTQSIPLPLNAYSFALVRYDNDYEVINGITIEDIFIDSDNYFDNTIDWNVLNNRSLNNVFITSQLNASIANNQWTTFNQAFFDINGYVLLNQAFSTIRDNSFSVQPINSQFYFRYTILENNSLIGQLRTGNFASGEIFVSTLLTPTVGTHSFIINSRNGAMNVLFINLDPYTSGDIKISEALTYNLTTLGISSLTKTNLDNFYSLFENVNNNNFIYTGYSTNFVNPTFAFDSKLINLTDIFGAGNEPNQATIEQYYDDYLEYLEYLYVCCNIFATQTISFETIYFDDGVSTEIQRLGSILIFTLIGFTLMIFGFVSRRRIFNLLSIGAFIVLGFLLIDFVGFIIILFGLVFINVYYTFFGEL